MSEETTLEIKGLDQILKALKSPPPQARVGIFGSYAARTDSRSSNVEIGAAHEFGSVTRNLPQRSFLRVPLSNFLGKEMQVEGAIDKDTINKVIKSGSVLPWLEKVTVIAERIVRGAFDTQGYGKWAGWKHSDYENLTGMVLVDTQQLRDSIHSEVVGR